MTVVVPTPKAEPLAGPCVRVRFAPGLLSDTVGSVQFTTAVHSPASALRVILLGQFWTMGGWLSTTRTLKLQGATLPELSVAVYVIPYWPTACREPRTAPPVWATLTPGQLSLAVGSGQVITASGWPGSVLNC